MKVSFLIIFLTLTKALVVAQQVVDVTVVDSKGVSKTIKTDKPDTVMKKAISKQIMIDAGPGSEPIFRSKRDSLSYLVLENHIAAARTKAPEKLDSLYREYGKIMEGGILGYRKVYRASFTPLDSLKLVKDLSQINQVSIIKFKGNKLPKEIFTCKNLEELELVNTSIKRIQGKLNKLPKLKRLIVLNNRPSVPLKLAKNTKIKTMIIRGENPSLLPANYKGLKNLSLLDLSNNNLEKFPTGMTQNKNLKQLLLTNNAITLTQKEDLPSLQFLEKLDLSKNRIRKVPAQVSNFTSLKQLKFNFNFIDEVSPDLAKLEKLEALSFYNNKLLSIPTGVYQLKNLRELDLYYNEIEKLEYTGGQWPKLEVLYLSFNRVYSVPDNIGKLSLIRELYLHDNRLISIPESIGKLTSLKVLRINNNLLTHLPESLINLTALENIDFSNNSISTLPIGLQNYTNLKILAMVNNPWEESTKDTVVSMAKELRKRNVVVHLNSYEIDVEE